MNSKMIFAFLTGVGIGVVGSCIYWHKRCEDEKQAVIDDYKANYKSSKRYPTVDVTEEGAKVNPVDEAGKPVRTKSSLGSEPVEVEATNYADLSKVYAKPDISELEELDTGFIDADPETVLAAGEHPSEEEPCREISFDEFVNAEGMDNGSLVWYIGDDVVTDAEGNEIEYPHDILGDALESLDRDECAGKGTIYIRNEITGVDYDVDVADMSYSDIRDDVGGVK